MKREGSAPDLGRGLAGRGPAANGLGRRSSTSPRTRTATRGREAIQRPMQTAEIDVARDRRVTLTSPIPAIIAESMVRERSITPRRDPAAPQVRARRTDPARRRFRSGAVGVGTDVEIRRSASRPGGSGRAQRIDEARAALDAGDLSAAVTAAESALHEADEAPAPGIVEVIEPARPLLNRVFTAYIGPSTGLPILAPRARRDRAARGWATASAPSCGESTAAARWKSCSTGRAWARWMPCASSRG